MLYALTGDQRFRDARAQAIEIQKRGEPIQLKSFLEEAEMKGRAEGRSEGIAIGEERGEKRGDTKARQNVMNRLIQEKGWAPQEAASFLGLTV